MKDTIAFIHTLRFRDLPPEVVQQARRCLLDLIGVAAGGRGTKLAGIACKFAAQQMGANNGARILFDGRQASPVGAAYAGAAMIDALDAHDGHALTKGHAGAALLPALLAVADAERAGARDLVDGQGLLTTLTLGYEIAIRAGIALHASAPDYHTSGAWNALGCAAMAARLLKLEQQQTVEALGIAEYHGPRSQMMRCIDHPTMVKDGSGWGALAGVSAAYLAADGFTGAPALTVSAPDHSVLWADLGSRWRIRELYFKPEPICRWAQPATEAARRLRVKHKLQPQSIAEVRIETFDAAVRLGSRMPATTEEAQYAIGFPVAVMLLQGRVGPADVDNEALRRVDVREMCKRIALLERSDFTARFPRERVATLSVTLSDGRILNSDEMAARGDPERPLSDQDIGDKFHDIAGALVASRRQAIIEAAASLDQDSMSNEGLFAEILSPI
jgi:2-methylcitrate dehydratase PrpD